ncbi:hypothetical protein ANCCAN_15861 [Ancylostoma caninum]|uniref:ATP-dependent DNA helicase n=1 Tax=Ancylostoma caninum TaxID=29170 RepID=A0A368G6E5_ANCCA|nr:hypothetical protein ANCCAN_15861 [Ancylostoma caninum]
MDASSATGLMLRNIDVIIWDEISMQTRFAVECVDRLLRDIAAPENSALPFGGVIMVFGRDWCQFLPVVPGGSHLEIINETLKSSPLWQSMTIHILDQNMRLLPGEEKHAEWLRAVGEVLNFMSDGTHIAIDSCMCPPTEKDVINWIYTVDTLNNPELLGRVALLTVRNCDAIELNDIVLRMLPCDITELYGIDTLAPLDAVRNASVQDSNEERCNSDVVTKHRCLREVMQRNKAGGPISYMRLPNVAL